MGDINTFSIEATERLNELDEGEVVLPADNISIMAAEHSHMGRKGILDELMSRLLALSHGERRSVGTQGHV